MDDIGVTMCDFCLNLAASNPLELFAPEEMDTEGNIYYDGHLPAAWFAATLCRGSIHLFDDIQLQANCLSAQTCADMQDNNGEFLVPTLGNPSPAWTHMPPRQ